MENLEEKLLINEHLNEVAREMLATSIPAEPNIGELPGLFGNGDFYNLSDLKNKYKAKWVAVSVIFEEYLKREGGKRQRSLLALAGYKVFSGGEQPSSKIINAGVGIELLHEAALILDDVMDNSTIRRGAPSLWADIATKMAIDEDEAKKIAAELGALCFAWSRDLLIDESEIFWNTVNAMKRGQVLDIKSARNNKWPELEEAIEWEYLKTATYSIELPLLVALRVAEAPEGEKEKIEDSIKIFARGFGLALQLNDDLFIFKTSKEIGKESLADALNGNKIPLAILARQFGSHEQKEFLDLVWGHGDKLTAGNVEKLKDVFRETGALKNITQRITEEIKNAEFALQQIKEIGFNVTPLNYLAETGRGWAKGLHKL